MFVRGFFVFALCPKRLVRVCAGARAFAVAAAVGAPVAVGSSGLPYDGEAMGISLTFVQSVFDGTRIVLPAHRLQFFLAFSASWR